MLEGDWNGLGTGGYPTIADFEYREHLRVRVMEDHGVLHYLQSTWRIDGDTEHGSHKETGFITLTDDAEILVLNAQGPDRLESLRGVLDVSDDLLKLALTGTEFLNDERMLSSWRRLRCTDDMLSYTMGMATTGAPGGELHLTAELHRAHT
jgi:hypothetical protein